MLKDKIADRYAVALFQAALSEEQVEKIEEELRVVSQVFESTEDLRRILSNPQVRLTVKKQVVLELFADNISKQTQNFLNVILDHRREVFLPAVIERYFALADEARNVVQAQVTSAVELPVEQQKDLRKLLSEMCSKEAHVAYIVDADIIGGLVIRVGDRIIDASVKRQLERLKENIHELKVG